MPGHHLLGDSSVAVALSADKAALIADIAVRPVAVARWRYLSRSDLGTGLQPHALPAGCRSAVVAVPMVFAGPRDVAVNDY